MTCSEQQQEELEVLRSIYDGDDRFKEVSSSRFQYRAGETSEKTSVVVEVSWPETYPEMLPSISLDAFYNNSLLTKVKHHIVEQLLLQAQQNIGTAVTYTLFEYVKENVSELMKGQNEAELNSCSQENESQPESVASSENRTKEKKEQLTKAQKRRLYNRLDQKGEMPRGWNWVDVVKHLSQTGKMQPSAQEAT